MLRDREAALGARFEEYQGSEAPAEYAGHASAEFVAALDAVVLMDRSAMGRIELSGADRIDFLQRMTSNDMRPLKEGRGNQTILTTPEAHIVELLTVFPESEALLCITSPQNRVKVYEWFRHNIFFRDKVKPRDVSAETSQLTLYGPKASELLSNAGVFDSHIMAAFECLAVNLSGAEVLVGRLPELGGGFDLVCSSTDSVNVWDALLLAGERLGVLPMGTIAYDMLRIDAGQPRYGAELSEEINPLEAGLNHAISYSKGCYTGQEVIARLDTYQRLKQRLARFELTGRPSARAPILLRSDSAEVGQLTSVAQLPDGKTIGLGYVRVKAFAEGAVYSLVGEDNIQARLIAAVTSQPAKVTA